MRNLIKIFLMIGAVFYAGLTLADALNQTTVVVTDRSAPALQQALQSAFSEVMMKMSGNPNEMTSPVIQKAESNVTQWVQSYSYVEQLGASSQATPTLMLQVVFDQTGLQQLLQKAAKKSAQLNQLNQLNQPSQSSHSPSTVMMVVSGVRSVADYVQVMHALRDKSDVVHVSVSDMQSDHVLLKVKVIGNSTDFQKMLALDSNFKSSADGVQSKQLQYYWMGNQA